MTPAELRRMAQDTLNLCLPWDSKEEHYCFPEDSWTDVETLCKYILSAVREDDGEAITEEWLTQIANRYSEEDKVWLIGGKLEICKTGYIWHIYGMGDCQIETRGQLRRLLEGLGVDSAV